MHCEKYMGFGNRHEITMGTQLGWKLLDLQGWQYLKMMELNGDIRGK